MESKADASTDARPELKGASALHDLPTVHVALDVRSIRRSGIGTAVRGLLDGFAELLAPVEWTMIGPRVDLPESLRVRDWIEFDAPLYSRREFFDYPELPHVDLLHYPHYNLPRARVRRRLVTVYDLFHLHYGSPPKRVYQRFFLKRLAWSDASAIVVSNKTAEDLTRHCSIPPSRLWSIEPGPGRPAPVGAPAAPPRAIELSDGTRLESPWLLATGIDQPHKNMDFLIAALAMWHRRRPEAPPLIWTGLSPEALKARAARMPAEARRRVLLETYREPEFLEALHRGALALVFPSLDEGFGFPPLEAMARGTPVVCAERRPMTDLLGDAPLWFDPVDSASLWGALDRLIDEPGLRERTIERGRRQVHRFSWLECARRTYRLYCHLLESDW